MINWLKKLFKSERQNYYPASKEIFASTYSAYFGTMEMMRKAVESSQSGDFIEIGGKPVFLRSKGELSPEPYNAGKEEFKAKWFPKSGWSLAELRKLDMITEEEYNFGNLFNKL